MSTRQQDIDKVKSLRHGTSCTLNWHEEGGAEVWCLWDEYVLFDHAQYGGNVTYYGTFRKDEIENLVDIARSWT